MEAIHHVGLEYLTHLRAASCLLTCSTILSTLAQRRLGRDSIVKRETLTGASSSSDRAALKTNVMSRSLRLANSNSDTSISMFIRNDSTPNNATMGENLSSTTKHCFINRVHSWEKEIYC